MKSINNMFDVEEGKIVFITINNKYYLYRFKKGDINYHNTKQIVKDMSICFSEYSIDSNRVYVNSFFDKNIKQDSVIFFREVREIEDLTDYLAYIL
jgi:hypothetical protein